MTLDEQDRSRWDHAAIGEALDLLARPRPRRAVRAPGADRRLPRRPRRRPRTPTGAGSRTATTRSPGSHPSPVIELNRAVAHGYAHGPAAGLALLAAARAGGALDDYPLAVAAEAELTARDGDRDRAAGLFREAAARAHGAAERRALLDRAAAL